MRFLKFATSVDLPIGPFLSGSDGVTPLSALTLTQPDIRLKKNGAAWAQKAAAQTLSHEENGFYEVTLDATDTNTLGHLRLAVFEGGGSPAVVPVWEDFQVIPAEVYDAMFGAGVAEPTAVFAWPANFVKILAWLGVLSRNKITVTGGTQVLRNDADSGTIATSVATDSGGTTSRPEWS